MVGNTRFNRAAPKLQDRQDKDLQRRTLPVDPGQALEFSQLLQRKGEFERSQVLEREKEAAEQQSQSEAPQVRPQRTLPAAFMASGAHFLPAESSDTHGATAGGIHTASADSVSRAAPAGVEQAKSTTAMTVDRACEVIYAEWASPEPTRADKLWTIELPQGGQVSARLQIERTAGNEWIVRVAQDTEQHQHNSTAGGSEVEADTLIPELQQLCEELQSRLNAGQSGASRLDASDR